MSSKSNDKIRDGKGGHVWRQPDGNPVSCVEKIKVLNQNLDEIRQLAETIPGVARVEKCFVRKMGYQLYVDMHVEVDPQMTVLCSHKIAHDVKDKIRDAMPVVSDVLVHIEPLGLAARPKRDGATSLPPPTPE